MKLNRYFLQPRTIVWRDGVSHLPATATCQSQRRPRGETPRPTASRITARRTWSVFCPSTRTTTSSRGDWRSGPTFGLVIRTPFPKTAGSGTMGVKGPTHNGLAVSQLKSSAVANAIVIDTCSCQASRTVAKPRTAPSSIQITGGEITIAARLGRLCARCRPAKIPVATPSFLTLPPCLLRRTADATANIGSRTPRPGCATASSRMAIHGTMLENSARSWAATGSTAIWPPSIVGRSKSFSCVS